MKTICFSVNNVRYSFHIYNEAAANTKYLFCRYILRLVLRYLGTLNYEKACIFVLKIDLSAWKNMKKAAAWH